MIAILSMAQPVAIAIAVIGIGISLLTGEWKWFSRSGSLIVAFGIYVAFFDIDSWEYRLRRGAEDRGDEIRGEDQFFHHIRRWFTKSHLTIILYGTLIWGFGDLIDDIVLGTIGLVIWLVGLIVGG